jgi:ABC-2 type transport system ATP-binding protein
MRSPSWAGEEGAAVEVVGLHRVYHARTSLWRPTATAVQALRGIDFSIRRGELFGLLGPNGAGKTTTIKILATLLLPTKGSARVGGFDVVRSPTDVRRLIGYVFGGDRGFYDRLSARDNLMYFSELYEIPYRTQGHRVDQLLERVGLRGSARRPVEGYSRGMRQRLHIARGLLNEPSVLFLDEPTIGLDPVAARDLRDLIIELNLGGTTILLTTHNMQEADNLCARVAIIAEGRLLAVDRPATLKSRLATRKVVDIDLVEVDPASLAAMGQLPEVTSLSTERMGDFTRVSAAIDGEHTTLGTFAQILDSEKVIQVVVRAPSLEDVYLSLVSSADSI